MGLNMDEKRAVGRPRTTLDDLPNDWQEIMVQCGQEGGSATEARCLLGIGINAWETLLEDYPEFCEAESKRKSLSEVWWERTGRGMATGAQGNAIVWIFNMKNRFGWRDKQEVEHSGGIESNTPQINLTLSGVTANDLTRKLTDENQAT